MSLEICMDKIICCLGFASEPSRERHCRHRAYEIVHKLTVVKASWWKHGRSLFPTLYICIWIFPQ